MSLDPVAFKKTKHILRAAEFLRDLVARDVVRLQHLPGSGGFSMRFGGVFYEYSILMYPDVF